MLHIMPTRRIQGTITPPSSKYATVRYVLAATLAQGKSCIRFPAASEDSTVLFRCCRALGAELSWQDEQQQILIIQSTGRPYSNQPLVLNVGNAGAVLRFLLGIGALLPEVTFMTDYPESLGKRPNRELLEALTTLGARCQGTGAEGYVPITIRGGNLHGGQVEISGIRSSQYLSSLLFLAPLLDDDLEIHVIGGLKSRPFVRATLTVLQEAGIDIAYDQTLRRFHIAAGQCYHPREYLVPGDYPSAAVLLAICAVASDPCSELILTCLDEHDEIGRILLDTVRRLGVPLQRDGGQIKIRGGQPLHAINVDGDAIIDCIPVLVAAACFADGESLFYNIESLHYKESDRIVDLCIELQRAGCDVTAQKDAISVRGRPEGIEGGVIVDGHHDHRLLMALAVVAMRSRRGLTLTGIEHIAKSYPHFFKDLQCLGVTIYQV